MMVGPGLLRDPKNFREIVLADLYRGQRLVAKVHPDPIDPQFRIATSEGDWAIAITLPADARERAQRLQLGSDFMAWKVAAAFTITSELHVPDCVYAMGVAHRERYGCLSRITRNPRLDFGSVEWIPDDALGTDIPNLLPRGALTLTADRLRVLRDWFGANGRFPAINIDRGEVGA